MARRRWRDYQTARGGSTGARLRSLSDEDYADVGAAMDDVAEHGLPAARHLRGDSAQMGLAGAGDLQEEDAEDATGQTLRATEVTVDNFAGFDRVPTLVAQRWRSDL